MFALALLIIGQTILGPMGVASAEGVVPEPVTQVADPAGATVADSVVEESISSEEVDSSTTPELEDEKEEEPTETPIEAQKPGEGDSANKEGADAEVDTDPEENAEQVSFVNLEDEEELPLSFDDYELGVLNAKLDFANLIVNGFTITKAEEAAQVTPKLGDKVDLNYTFSITADKNHEVGSTFEFELPQALLNFDNGKLSGTITDPETGFSVNYTTSGRTVTVITTKRLDEADAFTGTLHFIAHFSADGTNGDLDQDLKIPIVGGDSVDLPFIFKPILTGDSMSKKGTSSIGVDGQRYIEWEIWTNREGANLSNAEVVDTLGGEDHGLELEGKITVEKFPVGLTGPGASAGTTEADNFPVKLEDGRNAYKLTYKTKVTRTPTETTESFTNSATLKNNNGTSNPVTATATHTYGTKLDKTATIKDKYLAKWEVKYNYFGSKGTKTLTDTVTAPHKIVKDTIKVFSVSVNAAGKGEVGAMITPQPEITMSTDNRTFSMVLDSQNGEAYFIKYDTVLDQEFVEEGGEISNKISDGTNKDGDGFSYSQNIIGKNRTAIDFDTKEITWKIDVDIEQATKEFTITDIFHLDGDGESRQTLLNHDNNPFKISGDLTSATSQDITDPKKGFTLGFGDLTKGTKFSITYKTKFDILPNGTPYPLYKNTATANWVGAVDGKPYRAKDNAEYKTGNTNTGNNGYKNGSFDHVKQEFSWNLAVNINKQEINGATLVDVIKSGHELKLGTVKVHKLKLSGNDTGEPDEEVTTGFTKTEVTNGFTITFNIATTDAYIITYQTIDSDDIIGNNGTDLYENTAIFKTIDDREFELQASTTVKNANKLIHKKAVTDGSEETIAWTVDVNESHSALGNIILTDKMSLNQLILPGTFTKSAITMDAQGNLSYGTPVPVTPVINSTDNSFTLDLDNLNQKGYRIQYKTFFLGGEGDKFSNEASISYAGVTTGVENESGVKDEVFNFNDSGGTISAVKGKLEIHKVGLNPNSGEQKNLEGIPFTLWNKTKTIELATGTTSADGKLTFEDIRYGKYVLEEGTNPHAGYLPWEDKEITMGVLTDFNENGGKLYVVENIEDTPASTCTNFTLTVQDVDGDPRADVQLKLVNKNTGATVTAPAKTNAQGQVVIDRTILSAGPYEVFEIDGQTEVELGKVIVNYDNCEAEVQPAPSCPLFTITVKDGSDNVRPNVTVTVKDKAGLEIKTDKTNTEGKITIDSDELPAGKYDVFENDLLLGEIDVTYIGADKCEAEVIGAGSCPNFTLTVNDLSNNPREDIEVTVKNAAGTPIKIAGETIYKTGTTITGNAGIVSFPSSIEPGTYTVYEVVNGNEKRINTFTVTDTCNGSVRPIPFTPGPTPTCDAFTITVKQDGVIVKAGVDLVLKLGETEIIAGKTKADGTIAFAKGDLPQGTYKAFDKDGNDLGSVTVTYTQDECQAVVNMIAKTCDAFTVTVKENGKPVGKDVTLTIKDKDDKTVTTGKTDKDGKIVFDKTDLPKGAYKIFDKEGNEVGAITVSYDGNCEDEVNLTPKTCEAFTVTVKQSGKTVGKDVLLALKDDNDAVFTTGKTNATGEIVFDKLNLPKGKYTAYDEDGKAVGTVFVSYEQGDCQAVVDIAPKTCDAFTVSVKKDGEPVGKFVLITLKDKDGKEVTSVRTGAGGKIVYDKLDLPKGTYTAYDKDDKEVGTIVVSYEIGKCQAELDIVSSTPDPGTPDPGKPETPDPGTPDPGKPGTPDPGKPETPGPETPGPETPGPETPGPETPGPETPGPETPGPETPGPETPGPETPGPETPGPETPGPETPGPETPGPETPGPETPGPETPGPETPGPETPGPETPGPETPGPETPGDDNNTPGGNNINTPGNGDKPGSNNVSGQANNQNKLPQTGEELFMYMIALGGLFLVAGGTVLFRQRRKA